MSLSTPRGPPYAARMPLKVPEIVQTNQPLPEQLANLACPLCTKSRWRPAALVSPTLV